MRSCANCAHVVRDGEAFHCRRYPPQLVILPGVPQAERLKSIFPGVRGDFVCGEFLAKAKVSRARRLA